MKIIDFFHETYNYTFKFRFQLIGKLFRFFINHVANLIIPLVLSYSKIDILNADRKDFYVSLTSFPARINSVHLVIMCLLRQTVLPKKIVLWLSREQFPTIDTVPKKLVELQSDIFEVILVDGDLRCFKKYKYIYDYFGEVDFVIVDDDIFYHSDLLETLYRCSLDNPSQIICNRCYRINLLAPYSSWHMLKNSTPKIGLVNIMPTGCGGVYYPFGSLNELAFDESIFLEVCPDADDIWLAACADINNTMYVYSGCFSYLLNIKIRNNINLHTSNVGNHLNDVKIKDVQKFFKSICKVPVFNHLEDERS